MEVHDKAQGPEQPEKVVPHSFKQAINSEYLTAEDLQGKQPTVRLVDVELKVLEGEDGTLKRRNIWTFEGKDKRWVSNRTNDIILEFLHGPDPTASLRHSITLGTRMTPVGMGIIIVGSPEFEKDRVVSIKLPRRKAFKHTLKATGKPGTKPSPSPNPPDPREWFLDECANLPVPLDPDGARQWAEQCHCPWDATWGPEQIKVLTVALTAERERQTA